MADVRDSIALDEVIAAAMRIAGPPDPRAHNQLVDLIDAGTITEREYCIRMAAIYLNMLAWTERLDRTPEGGR